MQPPKKPARVDTAEIKSQLVKKLGPQRAELYIHSLNKFLGFQLDKSEFDKICVAALGKENIKLHNSLVRSILSNAFMGLGPPPSRQTPTGNSQTSAVTNGPLGNGVPLPRRVRPLGNRDRRCTDKPSPLGKSPLGNPGAAEFVSVEDGEEVDQDRGSPLCVQSQSPIRAPLGVATVQQPQFSALRPSDVCYINGELPDTECLSKILQDKLDAEGLSMPVECANLLNSGLNAYIRQLLKSCLDVAKARGNTMRAHQANGNASSSSAALNGGLNNGSVLDSGRVYQASLVDLSTAVQSNPKLLGCDSVKQKDKIASHLAG
ncbi:uncharacterized protein LOC100830991 [Brachypodium distachyon]|uniref:Transcriptional coactivator Hfi1/Transcriptional adapter 1 n=1 Tax=Brachypodium distachyon TaxID=15368 RepID=I1IH55_BRADI|nr:uncharacterized protein LOC100830991 [Brachypodium distachyon]KQJ86144.1 hypothetical protein BRADI_4g03600v3 [Brachypodium distachyon]|eukprot:XP_003579250.1 uncharacterized protein LOC100830991 [Brachypodium distachyon]